MDANLVGTMLLMDTVGADIERDEDKRNRTLRTLAPEYNLTFTGVRSGEPIVMGKFIEHLAMSFVLRTIDNDSNHFYIDIPVSVSFFNHTVDGASLPLLQGQHIRTECMTTITQSVDSYIRWLRQQKAVT